MKKTTKLCNLDFGEEIYIPFTWYPQKLLTISFFEGMSHSEQFLDCFSLSKGRWVVVAMRSIFVAISRSATW
jgi:hypothetical protein